MNLRQRDLLPPQRQGVRGFSAKLSSPLLRFFGIAALLAVSACARYTSDAPPDIEHLGNSWGVAVKSVRPPYWIMSESDLPSSPGHQTWRRKALLQRSVTVTQGCFRDGWCWNVSAPPELAKAWDIWVQDRQAHCELVPKSSCISAIWRVAFRRLYATAHRLIGAAPLPLTLHLFLLPRQVGYRAYTWLQSDKAVPLEFAVRFPTDTRAPGFAFQANRSIAAAIGLVAYEFQHIEYAAGQTAGPRASQASSATKNEANSECWSLSARAEIAEIAGTEVRFNLPGRVEMQFMQALVGRRATFRNAAVRGPVLVRALLGHELSKHFPSVKIGSNIVLYPADTQAFTALLSFCQCLSQSQKYKL